MQISKTIAKKGSISLESEFSREILFIALAYQPKSRNQKYFESDSTWDNTAPLTRFQLIRMVLPEKVRKDPHFQSILVSKTKSKLPWLF